MTVDSEAIFALDGAARARPARPLGAARRDGHRLARRARAATRSSSPAASRRPLWIGESGGDSSSPRRGGRSRSSRPRSACELAQREVREGRLLRVVGRADRSRAPLPPRPRLPRGGASSRPCARRTRPSPASSALGRASRFSGSSGLEPPSGATSTPSSRRRSRTRNWNAVQAPRGDVEQPVHLPLREQRVVCSPRVRPVGHLRQPPERRARAPRPARSRARAAPRPGHLEPGLAQRVRERSERVRVERLRRQRPAALCEVAGGRRPPELLAEPRSCSSSSSRVRKRRGNSPAARLAAFHVPKCSITVCGWTRASGSCRELAHRRRAAEARGAPAAAPRGSARRV